MGPKQTPVSMVGKAQGTKAGRQGHSRQWPMEGLGKRAGASSKVVSCRVGMWGCLGRARAQGKGVGRAGGGNWPGCRKGINNQYMG